MERWFAELTGKAVRRGSFAQQFTRSDRPSSNSLNTEQEGKAFVWTAKAETILEKLERCKTRLGRNQTGMRRQETSPQNLQYSYFSNRTLGIWPGVQSYSKVPRRRHVRHGANSGKRFH